MIEIGKKLVGVEGCGAEGEGSGALVRGISLPNGARVWGGGCAPSAENF